MRLDRLWALGFCLCACRDAAPPTAASVSTAAPQRTAAAIAKPLRYRLASRDSARVDALEPLIARLGQRIQSGPARELALDIDDDVRVSLAPETELWWLEPSESFVLVSGALRVLQLPAAAHAGRAAVRLACSGGAAVLSSAVSFELRSAPAHQPEGMRARNLLALLSGGLTWFSAATQTAPEPRRLTPDAPASTLSLVKVVHSQSETVAAWPHVPAEPVLQHAAEQLQAALDTRSRTRARSHELLAKATSHETGPVRAYQRELAQNAQDQLAHAEWVRGAVEQQFLSLRFACATTAPCAELVRWAEQITPLLRQPP